MTPPRVLVIDDNDVDRERVRRLIGRSYAVIEASTAAEGLRRCEEERPDCVIVDYRLPDADGVDVVRQLGSCRVPIVMLSGNGNEDVAVAAIKLGAKDYLRKDTLSADALRDAIERAVRVVRLERDLEAAHAAAVRSEARLRMVLQQLPAVVWTTDPELVVTTVTGRHNGHPLLAVGARVEGAAEEAHREALAGLHGRFVVEHGGRMFEAHVEALDPGAGADGAIGIAVDVTERRRLEDMLQHAQRIDALGRLAGGVAHDFNNLLTVILSSAHLARQGLPDGTSAAEDIDAVMEAAHRAAELTDQLLAFSRRRPRQEGVLTPSAALPGLVRMIERVLGDDVTVRVCVRKEGWRVQIDEGNLAQVLMNLAVNARDAMPGGGRLVVELDQIALDEAWVDARGEDVAPGEYVRLSVTDSGSGMRPEVLARIFEPFFTTKPIGKGTGLGLATVYGIVKQAGGAVRVYSEPGHGTTFHVYLPRVAVEASPAVRRTPTAERRRGAGTVLLVEDNEPLRALAERILGEEGYAVVSARNGQEALKALQEPRVVDLLVTDVVMPEMSGPELARRALAMRPGLRVLLMSGYAPEGAPGRDTIPPDVALLEKPFTPATLTAAVRDALAAAPPLS